MIKIGVVEDEMIIATSIVSTLKKLNYEVAKPVRSYAGALEMIASECPDLLLLDVNLGGQKDGIDIAQFVRQNYQIPIIYLTANSDAATIQRAKHTKPNAFLVKPFTKDDLYSAIEIAIFNYYENSDNASTKDHVILKAGYGHVNLKFSEIVFIESRDNYISLHLNGDQPKTIRSTLIEMLDKLPAEKFTRINRSVIVNCDYITEIQTDQVFINEQVFTITSKVKQELLDKIGPKS